MSELLRTVIEDAIQTKKAVQISNKSGKYGGLVYVIKHDGSWLMVSYQQDRTRWFLLPISELTSVEPYNP